MLLSELESRAFEPTDDEPNPPQICEGCGEAISEGYGWYSDDLERVLCTGCYLPHTRRARRGA